MTHDDNIYRKIWKSVLIYPKSEIAVYELIVTAFTENLNSIGICKLAFKRILLN